MRTAKRRSRQHNWRRPVRGAIRTKDGLTVGFQHVPEAKVGKNRLHVDLVVEDLDTATTEIEALGGRRLEPGSPRELEGFRWRVMADPEGNEFDIDVLPPSTAQIIARKSRRARCVPVRQVGDRVAELRTKRGPRA